MVPLFPADYITARLGVIPAVAKGVQRAVKAKAQTQKHLSEASSLKSGVCFSAL